MLNLAPPVLPIPRDFRDQLSLDEPIPLPTGYGMGARQASAVQPTLACRSATVPNGAYGFDRASQEVELDRFGPQANDPRFGYGVGRPPAQELREPGPAAVASAPVVQALESQYRHRMDSEKLVIADFPSVTQLQHWKIALCTQLANIYGARQAEVVEWLRFCSAANGHIEDITAENDTNKYEHFARLDTKLSQSLIAMLQKTSSPDGKSVWQRCQRMMTTLYRTDHLMTGRHLVFMICSSYKTFDGSDQHFSFDHLTNLEVKGDDLEDFLARWEHVTQSFPAFESIDQTAMCDVMYRKLYKSKAMELDIHQFQKFENGDPRRSYDWLMKQLEAAIRVARSQRNFEARTFDLSQGNRTQKLTKAAPAPDTTNAKAEGKPKQVVVVDQGRALEEEPRVVLRKVSLPSQALKRHLRMAVKGRASQLARVPKCLLLRMVSSHAGTILTMKAAVSSVLIVARVIKHPPKP